MTLPLRVDRKMDLADIAKAIKCESCQSSMPISGVALDSRALLKGDLFFALSSARDGHAFVADAFTKGAVASVVSKSVEGSGATLLVPDTLEALSSLASSIREGWGGKIVAISGSNGKTTTKEMTSALLSVDRPTLKAPGTWNNHLGVPLTLLMIQPEHQVAVLEMGMNASGELRKLSEIAKPDVAVLTNVGPAHLEKFGSLEGVAQAKGELFEGLGSSDVAVLNLDDRHVRKLGETLSSKIVTVSMGEDGDVTAKVAQDLGPKGYRLHVRYGAESIELQSPFVGTHNISNLLCALGSAYALGVPSAKLQEGVGRVEPVRMRLEVIELCRGIRVVNDCYNANPASMVVALEVTKNLGGRRLVAVVGDMMELGEYSARAHRDIGIKIAGLKYTHLYALGQLSGDVRQGAIQGGMSAGQVTVGKNHGELVEHILATLQPDDTILVKGSRGMKMEEISTLLAEQIGRHEER